MHPKKGQVVSPLNQWLHFRRRGHEGKVNQVKGCEGLDYLASGGEDGTMRIWEYKGRTYDAYDLAGVVVHSVLSEKGGEPGQNVEEPGEVVENGERSSVLSRHSVVSDEENMREENSPLGNHAGMRSLAVEELQDFGQKVFRRAASQSFESQGDKRGVTCVEGVGTKGPFIGGTADGWMSVFSLNTGKVYKLEKPKHDGMVNDMATLPYEEGALPNRVHFVLATVGKDGKAFIRIVSMDERYDMLETPRGDAEAAVGSGGYSTVPGAPPETAVAVAPAEESKELTEERVVELRHEKESVDIAGIVKVVALANHQACLDDERRPCFATATTSSVHCWNLRGEELWRLDERTCGDVRFADGEVAQGLWKPPVQLASDIKDNGTLVFAGGGHIGVWSLDKDGKPKDVVWKRASCDDLMKAETADKRAAPRPSIVYDHRWMWLDVDQTGVTTDFVVARQDDWTVVKWEILAIQANKMALEPAGPDALLIKPGSEQAVESMAHSGKITSLSIGNDPDETGGPALVVGLDSGEVCLWDVEGEDSGQIYAALRSLTPVEILIPVANLIISNMQMLSFAFGKAVPWRPEVRKASLFVHEVAMLDADFIVTITREAYFYLRSYVVLTVMVLFFLSAITGFPEALTDAMLWLQLQEQMQHEELARRRRNSQSNGTSNSSSCQPYAWLVSGSLKAIRCIRHTWNFILQLCATILVVPMCKAAARIVDCVRSCDGKRYLVEELAFLEGTEPVVCMGENHLSLAIVCAVVIPLYLWVLVPAAAVGGDMSYVPRSSLFTPRLWRLSAHRKATVIHMGIMHKKPANAFEHMLVDLLVKTTVPVIAQFTTTRPHCQLMALTLIAAIWYYVSVRWSPYNHDSFQTLVQDLRLFTLIATVCAQITLILKHRGIDLNRGPRDYYEVYCKGSADLYNNNDLDTLSLLPVVVLGVSAVGLFAHITWHAFAKDVPRIVLRAKVSYKSTKHANPTVVQQLHDRQRVRQEMANELDREQIRKDTEQQQQAAGVCIRNMGLPVAWLAGCLVGILIGWQLEEVFMVKDHHAQE